MVEIFETREVVSFTLKSTKLIQLLSILILPNRFQDRFSRTYYRLNSPPSEPYPTFLCDFHERFKAICLEKKKQKIAKILFYSGLQQVSIRFPGTYGEIVLLWPPVVGRATRFIISLFFYGRGERILLRCRTCAFGKTGVA